MKHDQHFMIDEDLARRIVDYLDVKKSDSVLEVGPGNGMLTQFLISRRLEVVEIDNELASNLKNKFSGLKIINKNILEFKGLDYDKIIGNLPYSICEPFMKLLLKSKFKFGIFTVPYSFLSDGFFKKIMSLFFYVKTLETIEKDAFDPEPNVMSKVICIKPKRLTIKIQFVKEIYSQSDKTLLNSIKESYCKVYGLTKKESLHKVPELKFLNKRVYTLNKDEWLELLESLDVRQ